MRCRGNSLHGIVIFFILFSEKVQVEVVRDLMITPLDHTALGLVHGKGKGSSDVCWNSHAF
jgi:hypothetical protein